jgi:hypothetical protein
MQEALTDRLPQDAPTASARVGSSSYVCAVMGNGFAPAPGCRMERVAERGLRKTPLLPAAAGGLT